MIIYRSIFVFSLFLVTGNSLSQDTSRTVVSLDGVWRFLPDPEKIDVASGWTRDLPENAINVKVPHTWNVMAGYEDYRGMAFLHAERI